MSERSARHHHRARSLVLSSSVPCMHSQSSAAAGDAGDVCRAGGQTQPWPALSVTRPARCAAPTRTPQSLLRLLLLLFLFRASRTDRAWCLLACWWGGGRSAAAAGAHHARPILGGDGTQPGVVTRVTAAMHWVTRAHPHMSPTPHASATSRWLARAGRSSPSCLLASLACVRRLSRSRRL